MRRWIIRGAAAFMVLLLCGFFAAALLFFTQPMTEQTFDLSVEPSSGRSISRRGNSEQTCCPMGTSATRVFPRRGRPFTFPGF